MVWQLQKTGPSLFGKQQAHFLSCTDGRSFCVNGAANARSTAPQSGDITIEVMPIGYGGTTADSGGSSKVRVGQTQAVDAVPVGKLNNMGSRRHGSGTIGWLRLAGRRPSTDGTCVLACWWRWCLCVIRPPRVSLLFKLQLSPAG